MPLYQSSHTAGAAGARTAPFRKRFAVALLATVALAVVVRLGVAPFGLSAPDAPPAYQPTPRADARMRAELLHDAPGLAADLRAGRRYDAARTILRWVAPRIVWYGGSTRGTLDTTPLSASSIWQKFRTVRAGVYCGGAADFYIKTLKLFGIPARYLGFGRRDIYTHATALVRVRQGWVLLDPTFDLELRTRQTGQPIDFAKAVRLGESGQVSDVVAHAIPVDGRPILSPRGSVSHCQPRSRVPACSWWALKYESRMDRFGHGVAGLLSLFSDGQLLSSAPPEVAAVSRSAGDRGAVPPRA
jgi:transglutaminase-like putative cysteine protease